MLLVSPVSASGLEASVLVGASEQKSGGHFGRAYDAGVAPTVAVMVGGAPRSWVSVAGELRVSWYRVEGANVGSYTHLGVRSFFDFKTAGDGKGLREFGLTLAPGLGLYEMHASRRGLSPPPNTHEDGLYASAMVGLTGWTMRSVAVGAFVEYTALLPFSSCILNELDQKLDCNRAAHGNTYLALLSYGLIFRF